MNVAELVADLRSRQDEATARAAELRARIEELAADLTDTEARLTDLATTRKIIAEVTPAGTGSEPPETNTTYQAIVNASNQHPDQAFRHASCTNSSACPPTRRQSTSPVAASDASLAKASSPNPDEAATRNGLNVH
ncbi:hypothetical protein AB0D08_40800 [Kitasatospora sp. NPDC048540]|uniref:hypothetical protein n=1 Tax=Kitasatospora sp. NPDC048540 TaxID=3155634 RepID=UPI0033C42D97